MPAHENQNPIVWIPKPLTPMEKLLAPIKIGAEMSVAAANYYSFFGTLAELEDPGKWLAIPVLMIGPGIGLFHEVVELLLRMDPDNEALQKLRKGSDFMHVRFGGFLSDAGYIWNLINMSASAVMGKEADFTKIGRIYAPIAAVPLGLLTSHINYLRINDQIVKTSIIYCLSSMLDNMSALSNPVGMFMDQGLLRETSYLPWLIELAGGLAGFLAAFSFRYSKKVSAGAFLLLQILVQNLAISQLDFVLIPDLSSSFRHGFVTKELLEAAGAIGVTIWVLLGFMSFQQHLMQARSEQDELSNLEAGYLLLEDDINLDNITDEDDIVDDPNVTSSVFTQNRTTFFRSKSLPDLSRCDLQEPSLVKSPSLNSLGV